MREMASNVKVIFTAIHTQLILCLPETQTSAPFHIACHQYHRIFAIDGLKCSILQYLLRRMELNCVKKQKIYFALHPNCTTETEKLYANSLFGLFNYLSTADINECDLDTNKCHSLADCINTAGSYHCMCKAGYRGNGKTCNREITTPYTDFIVSEKDWSHVHSCRLFLEQRGQIASDGC